MYTLRPYQQEAVNAIYDYFANGNTGNPIIVLPTGSGKSLCLAAFTELVLKWPKQRVLHVTHVRELIQQNHKKLVEYLSKDQVGIYSSGLKRKDTEEPVIVAGIQSIHKKALHLGYFNIIVIDEAHLCNNNSLGMYRRFLADAKRINPALKIVGFTATAFRMKSGGLTEGDDRIFTDIAYEKPLLELVEEGFLAPLVTKAMTTKFDLDSVRTQAGEFVQRDLEAAMDQDPLTKSALDEVCAYGHDRRSWLLFCSGVQHAEHVRDVLRSREITAETVTGKTPDGERDRILNDFKAGRIQALTGANVFTIGFDAPAVDLLIMLRPTRSPGLYVQMAGRGTRLSTDTGKTNCLVLDFAENISRHGPVDQIKAWSPKKRKKQTAPVKECPTCQTVVAASIRQCPDCKFEFPLEEEPKDRHSSTATDEAILSSQIDMSKYIVFHDITDTTYSKHEKHDKLPSLRVDYYSGFHRIASEWVCFEHMGYARRKAEHWWAKRTGLNGVSLSIPTTVDEALLHADQLKRPSQLTLNEYGKWPEIVDVLWDDESGKEAGDRHVA